MSEHSDKKQNISLIIGLSIPVAMILLVAIIFLNTHLKSKALLVFGSPALGVYLAKNAAQYFSNSIGWKEDKIR